MIAALYVVTGGAYFGLNEVDPWDIVRDARNYAGPYPVVAHPPCARWSSLAYLNQSQHGYKVGDDGGCFASALAAVRQYGGVLEHPAMSIAWPTFDLPRPTRGGWTRDLFDNGWTTEVSQCAYGHRARKRTWLYYVGPDNPPKMEWNEPLASMTVSALRLSGRERMYQAEALATPPAFRSALIDLTRSACMVGRSL